MKQRIVTRLPHLFVFLMASTIYICTLPSGCGLWDSPECIATATKLEVGHPPSAPLYLLIARIFSLFAPTPQQVPMAINLLSALASALTITFLFSIIKLLLVRLRRPTDSRPRYLDTLAALIGSLCFAFSSTFWTSATEAEVYALSTLCTTTILWAIFKWEQQLKSQQAVRWLLLISYLIGLSAGIHLLSFLTIPTIVLIYYFAQYSFRWRSFLYAIVTALVLLLFVLYLSKLLILKILQIADLFCVNLLNAPFNLGASIALLLIFTLLGALLFFSYQHQYTRTHHIILALSLFLLGYSSYTLIVVRSAAGTPINLSAPNNVFALEDYLNREQYGDPPLFYGPYYSAPISSTKDEYTWQATTSNYKKIYRKTFYSYDTRFCTLFPRMYSTNPYDQKMYTFWANIKGEKIAYINPQGDSCLLTCPTFAENLRYLLTYQLNHQYWRYFLWNFLGKQDDVLNQSNSRIHGNPLSGFNLLDELFIGSQSQLTTSMLKIPARAPLYALPLLLGLLGFVYLFFLSPRYNFALITLFFFTGLAIVLYLNQTPLQPRERDYAFITSFLTFAIWIGFAIPALYALLSRYKFPHYERWAALLPILSCILMFVSNLPAHNRHKQNFAREYAYNTLTSLAPGAILFTSGDNDTYPLWYLQEVEGVRTDVRVCNIALLSLNSYTSQLQQQFYNSSPLLTFSDSCKKLSTKERLLILIEKNAKLRPIYFTTPTPKSLEDLEKHLHLEGFTYKWISSSTTTKTTHRPVSNPNLLFQNLITNAKYSSIENLHILADYPVQQCVRTLRLHSILTDLADTLLKQGDTLRATIVLQRSQKIFQGNRFSYDEAIPRHIELLYLIKQPLKADSLLANELYTQYELLHYYRSQWKDSVYLPNTTFYQKTYTNARQLEKLAQRFASPNIRTFAKETLESFENE